MSRFKRFRKRFVFGLFHPLRTLTLIRKQLKPQNSYGSKLYREYLSGNQSESRLETKSQLCRLDWVIAPVGLGGGGATTISRFISEFNNRGVSQRISIYAEHAIDIQNQRKILRE